MELWALQTIADGIVSLEELEREHPILGGDLSRFVQRVNRCCRDAYERFSTCLDDVLTMGGEPSDAAKQAVLVKLRAASDSVWFREVARICDDLAAVADTYDSDIKGHLIDSAKIDSAETKKTVVVVIH